MATATNSNQTIAADGQVEPRLVFGKEISTHSRGSREHGPPLVEEGCRETDNLGEADVLAEPRRRKKSKRILQLDRAHGRRRHRLRMNIEMPLSSPVRSPFKHTQIERLENWGFRLVR